MADVEQEESEALEIILQEVRLDDIERLRLRLIGFYRKRPMLWDTSIKLSKKSTKEQRESVLKELERALCPPVHMSWSQCGRAPCFKMLRLFFRVVSVS